MLSRRLENRQYEKHEASEDHEKENH